jgi:hypothetical protein
VGVCVCGVCVCVCVWCVCGVCVCVCVCVLHIYIRIRKNFLKPFAEKSFSRLSIFVLETYICSISSHQLLICHNIIVQNVYLQAITNITMIIYWLPHLQQPNDLSCCKVFCLFCLFYSNLKRQMRTGCKLRMWTVVMFASLPHAVNFFSKTSDQYNIVTAFLRFNTLQAVQFVQYTVRHNKYSPQTTNVTFDGSCSKIKISSSLLSFYTGCI